jgi:hypothetical protein
MPLSEDFIKEVGDSLSGQFNQDFGNLDDIVNQCNVDRTGGEAQSSNPTDTAKQNYTAIRYGNDHGSISFGHIHEKADVTAAVILQTPDGRHQISMDKDGPRKGWTTFTAPGNIQIESGSDNQEAQDSLMINTKNGNIIIKANNGKIRLEGTDIELIAVGEGGSKGNIRMTATENISVDSKKFLVNASASYKICTPGTGEVISNGVLKMYGSIIQGVTDACAKKDSKVGGQRFQKQNTRM